MKKFVLLLVSVYFVSLNCSAKTASLNAEVTGKIKLVSAGKNIPDDLRDIFKGNSDTVPLIRTISVNATYSGQRKLRVVEDGEFKNNEKKYMFDFQVPSVMASLANGKQDVKSPVAGLLTAMFASENDLDPFNDDGDNSNSLVRTFKVKKHLNAKRKINGKARTSSVGKFMSIEKITARKRGNKGRVTATFSRAGTSAKGRFILDFVYE
ncbi:MAG: hypothetical protein LW817_07155 [Candidatus Caenarcaniphilales bacterium]|jgi:hypothetical protein|nr:hypothetical protein [Candidatus Caenarcaniphilales bacterium]